MYSQQVLDHFEHPRNIGELVDPDATVQISNPACGDTLKLTLKVSAGQIEEVRFFARGCVSAIACGSALTELVKGMQLERARQLGIKQLLFAVGGLPPAAKHGGHLALDALTAALERLGNHQSISDV